MCQPTLSHSKDSSGEEEPLGASSELREDDNQEDELQECQNSQPAGGAEPPHPDSADETKRVISSLLVLPIALEH